MINLTAKLKGLSERGLRFVGDKAKSIGQPTPDSHPHLMEEDESKCTQFNLTQCSLSSIGPLKNLNEGYVYSSPSKIGNY